MIGAADMSLGPIPATLFVSESPIFIPYIWSMPVHGAYPVNTGTVW